MTSSTVLSEFNPPNDRPWQTLKNKRYNYLHVPICSPKIVHRIACKATEGTIDLSIFDSYFQKRPHVFYSVPAAASMLQGILDPLSSSVFSRALSIYRAIQLIFPVDHSGVARLTGRNDRTNRKKTESVRHQQIIRSAIWGLS